MVKLIVSIMFIMVIIDLTIAFLWVGILGYRELKASYNEIFPNGLWIVKTIAKLGKRLTDKYDTISNQRTGD